MIKVLNTTRRALLSKIVDLGLTAAGLTIFSGCDVMGKRNIKHFGKTFEYLKSDELRTQQMGDKEIVVSNAEVSGESFGDTWRNIRFVDCDFVGGYELDLKATTQCVFQNCRMAGIISFGRMTNTRFINCSAHGESVIGALEGSANVVYDDCRFEGSDSDPNHWGGIGTYGEASFIRCKVKWFKLVAYTQLTLQDCETEDAKLVGPDPGTYLTIQIDHCKLRGLFNGRALIASLTVRDTVVDRFDLSGAIVQGDVLFERVQGGVIQVTVKEGANSLTIKDCRFSGSQKTGAYAGAFKNVLVENSSFTASATPAVNIGGGYEIDDKTPQPYLMKSMTLRKVTSPFIRSGRLNTELFRVEDCEFGTAEFQQSKIGRLEIHGTTILNHLDLSRTQVEAQDITLPPASQFTGRVDHLDGSNVKIGK